MVKTLHPQGVGSIPGQGTKFSHVAWCGQKREKKKKKKKKIKMVTGI